jgi:hypothetical protein
MLHITKIVDPVVSLRFSEGLPPFHFGLAPFLLGLPDVLYATKTEDPVLFPLVFCQQIEDLHTIFRTILCTSVFI